jgi:hypothetical protein
VVEIKQPKIIKEELTPYYWALQGIWGFVCFFLAEIILIIGAILYYCTMAEQK